MRMTQAILWAVFLFAPIGGVKAVEGRATMYRPGDKNCGSEKADGTTFTTADAHIAHRWLPLGTVGILCNKRTQQCVKATVRDRGPFGALRPCEKGEPEPYRVAGRTFHAKKLTWMRKCYYWQAQPHKLQQGFKYRGAFDITKPIATQIGLRAFDHVTFIYGESIEWKISLQKPLTVPLVSAILSELNRTKSERRWMSFLSVLQKSSVN